MELGCVVPILPVGPPARPTQVGAGQGRNITRDSDHIGTSDLPTRILKRYHSPMDSGNLAPFSNSQHDHFSRVTNLFRWIIFFFLFFGSV